MSQTIQALLRHLRGASPAGNPDDADLLDRFARQGDAAAFAALVTRHGPMVLAVCRRILGDPHDAEDAFQATFLVLVRKAGTLGRGDPVGAWLYGVACRVAAHARADRVRRTACERRATAMPAAEPTPAILWEDLRPVLDEEVQRLPDKYRVAVVLCYLDGKTYDEAAREIGCPKGTLATRLAKARELLRERLSGRGVALSAPGLAAVLADNAQAAVPALLFTATVEAATATAPAAVVTLAEEVLRAMSVPKLKAVTALLVAVGLLTVGVGAIAYHAAGGVRPTEFAAAPVPVEKADPDPGWIRVAAAGRIYLFRPDGTGRTEPDPVGVKVWETVSPDGKSVVYVHDSAVYVADVEGKNARRVSPPEVASTFPCWSPDGRRIAFLAPPDGRMSWKLQVHVMDRDGGNVRRVSDAPLGAGMHRFHPDGRLSYLAWRERRVNHDPADLVIGEGKGTPLVEDEAITDYAWSPDGAVLAYGKPGAIGFRSFNEIRVPREGTREIKLTDIDPRLNIHAPILMDWSPDGRAVACSMVFRGHRLVAAPKLFGDDEVFVIPREGKPTWFAAGGSFQSIEWLRGVPAGQPARDRPAANPGP